MTVTLILLFILFSFFTYLEGLKDWKEIDQGTNNLRRLQNDK
jgi:hypothetical protein